jgi:hypothetical protein
MKLNEALSKIDKIKCFTNGKQVSETVTSELKSFAGKASIEKVSGKNIKLEKGEFFVIIKDEISVDGFEFAKYSEKIKGDFGFFQIDENGTGKIVASETHLLYSLFNYVIETQSDSDVSLWKEGKVIETSFKWQRISYDYFLTQGGRTQKDFNREEYVKQLARLGFTTIEVNGLAYPMAMETGPAGETYPMFYTYCPALDQYVYSDLNKGMYPFYYLSANMDLLKKNSALARKYGLIPGMLCFEPRSVPERLFQKYPMLRGGRIDHPFRSFSPRYNLTITHPKVLGHYKEMIQKIMKEVPELGYMSVWTNDSGAGYEHTKSLYVGRNGGAYLIREWKNDDEIARLAGENILRFLRTLRDAASEINPDFRVITRLESFYGEHETVWAGLGNRIDVESFSVMARGWELPYSHPKYNDVKDVSGTLYHNFFDKGEIPIMKDLESRGGVAQIFYSYGPFAMFDPLIGIPYPWSAYEKLKSMHETGVTYTAHTGGINPPNLVPYSINQEVARIFQFDSEMKIDEIVLKIAKQWVGDKNAVKLVEAWKLIEQAIMGYPIPVIMFSTYGFPWYRLWTRPYVPNIEVIPEKERSYYEDFMCTTPHNPQNVDLMKDVLFELTGQKRCELAVERFDKYLWEPLEQAVILLAKMCGELPADSEAHKVFYDQLERTKVLKIWFKTMRSVSAWIAGVHGYLETADEKEKTRYRNMVKDMMKMEIENSKDLIDFIANTKISFMAVSEFGETPLIYGDNLVENLRKKIKLMEEHFEDEPYIDPNYMWRRAELSV